MTTVTFPPEIPHEVLRIAFANLGLVLDGRVQSDGSHRAIWAEDARSERICQHQGRTVAPTIKIGACERRSSLPGDAA